MKEKDLLKLQAEVHGEIARIEIRQIKMERIKSFICAGIEAYLKERRNEMGKTRNYHGGGHGRQDEGT